MFTIFLDSTSGAAIYVLSVVLVIVIAAIFVAAVMIHKKSRVSESHFSLKQFGIFENGKNHCGNDSLNSFSGSTLGSRRSTRSKEASWKCWYRFQCLPRLRNKILPRLTKVKSFWLITEIFLPRYLFF